jgi:gluconolactonase
MKTLLSLLSLVVACAGVAAEESFHGKIERFDPAFDRLVAPEAALEKLADGIRWAEGPVWYEGTVVFSDPPANIAYRWKPGASKLEVFLDPSGGAKPPVGFREAGSNGLILDHEGRLLLCQDGTRRIARYENGAFTTMADRCNGRRFSSPNDLAVRKSGDIYFTDPPYGLAEGNKSPLKEQPVNGVYRIAKDGVVSLVIGDQTYPNGIAFSPDEKVLYVNNSDSADSRITAYAVQPDGSVANPRRFFDGKSDAHVKGVAGWFDGLKVDRDGNLWTSGPGGILVISPQAKLLGRLSTGVPTANCAFAPDGTLYITANHFLLRVPTLTKGAGL